MKIRWKLLVLCLLVVYLISFIGTIFMGNEASSEWYKEIKPAITPPSFVFPIVWPILFFLIAISLYLALRNSKGDERKKIIFWFSLNLIFNTIWTLFYFHFQNPFLAFIDIILIDFTIIYLIVLTHRINKLSSYLLFPYLIWVSFASILNYLSI